MEEIKRKYPNLNLECILVGKSAESPQFQRDQPGFLWFVDSDSALPADMRGCLCLVGAGPWAEIYCAWVKQRGGVGVDIGSGFDLLDGQLTRPIHEIVGLEKVRQYAL